MMTWEKLFSSKRLGYRSRKKPRPGSEGRSEFQRDFDRVIFSPAFRRLQNKTQVVPLPNNDFVHTRLTHSMEASCVGRSLGRIVGDRIIRDSPEQFKKLGVDATDFEAVVAAACLAHDIGNPPFGHSGEDAISDYFKSSQAQPFLHGLSDKQVADLQKFEGNAAGFRLLTYTSPADSEINMGMGLTFSTLGAFTKYPKASLPDMKNSDNASERKFGFFQSEKEVFRKITEELELLQKSKEAWHRHPLAFVMEAADDICYSIIDFEDGFKLGRLPFETVEGLFKQIIDNDSDQFKQRFEQIHSKTEKIGFLRAITINKLVRETADVFTGHLQDIMGGEFDQHLIDLTPSGKIMAEISSISFECLYKAQDVVEIEIAGFEVLSGLLDTYLKAVFHENSKQYQLVHHIIPDEHLNAGRKPFPDNYSNIISIALLVASMTDTYAINTYRKIRGISLPNQ